MLDECKDTGSKEVDCMVDAYTTPRLLMGDLAASLICSVALQKKCSAERSS